MNALGFKKEDISGGYDKKTMASLLQKNIIKTAPPANLRKFPAQAWKEGMEFVFQRDNSQIFHWYYCRVCKKFFNLNLKNGTGTIRGHMKSHKKGKYEFTSEELQKLVAAASKAGRRGFNSDFMLPPPNAWNLDFLEHEHSGKFTHSQI